MNTAAHAKYTDGISFNPLSTRSIVFTEAFTAPSSVKEKADKNSKEKVSKSHCSLGKTLLLLKH